ncbi:MAG: beta-lactamase family protein, partial [Planctomycetaceae bacterium]|nr:beta-lactamase family protein [Planctomycetaceae bacterium]
MKFFRPRIVTLILLGLVTGVGAEEPQRPQQVSDAKQVDYAPAIERLKTAIRHEVEQKQLPAFSISLVDGDKMVWAAGFGFQDQDRKIRATENTVYRVGSVSKLFTDIAVMQLVESGAINLDATVQTYLPEFKPNNPFGGEISVLQLMTHRSGLVRESPVGNYFDPTEPSLAETVASLNDTALVYQPGTKTKYSNAAVAVVGAVLEKQLDVSHDAQVHQKILDPLKMDHSGFT